MTADLIIDFGRTETPVCWRIINATVNETDRNVCPPEVKLRRAAMLGERHHEHRRD
jgi:hypothetical protein